MLRQTLEEAGSEGVISETSSLLSSRQRPPTADDSSALSGSRGLLDSSDQYFFEDEEDDSSSASQETQPVRVGKLQKVWDAGVRCFLLIANVENLYDSTDSEMTLQESRRRNLVVGFWFVVLAAAYTGERSSFKLLVDRAGPFRLVAVEVVTFFHALLVGLGMLLSAAVRKNFQILPLGIPIVDVGLMALLDTIHILLVFLSGYHVPPTLTVILVQLTLPLTALLTQFVHPDGCCRCFCHPRAVNAIPVAQPAAYVEGRRDFHATSGGTSSLRNAPPDYHANNENSRRQWGGLSPEHIIGSIIIFLAVLLALCPAIYSIWDPEYFVYADAIPIQTALNTLLFVSSCIPAAASQLYKEHTFLEYKQPVQPDYLNFVISLFQFVFSAIMAPLVYSLLGLGAKTWPTYPSSGYSKNFIDGLRCFWTTYQESPNGGVSSYADDAVCDGLVSFVFFYALSVILVVVAVDKLVNAGATKLLYRGVSAAVIMSVTCLYWYDQHIPDFNYGPAVDGLNLVCVLLLVAGSEVYHRVSIPAGSFETVYPEIEDFYEE